MDIIAGHLGMSTETKISWLRCRTCIKVVAEWVSGLAQAEFPPLFFFIRLFDSFVQNQLAPWQPPHASLLPIVRGVIRYNLVAAHLAVWALGHTFHQRQISLIDPAARTRNRSAA
jgi:hypothetical protein